jgi:hypothetical protein
MGEVLEVVVHHVEQWEQVQVHEQVLMVQQVQGHHHHYPLPDRALCQELPRAGVVETHEV